MTSAYFFKHRENVLREIREIGVASLDMPYALVPYIDFFTKLRRLVRYVIKGEIHRKSICILVI
jgi:hypothetical protein